MPIGPDPKAFADNVATSLGVNLFGSTLEQAFTSYQQQVVASIPPPVPPIPPVPYLRKALPVGSVAKVGVHTMLWFNQNPANAHTVRTRDADLLTAGVLYDSRSLSYLASLVQVYLAAGADFALVDWYGSNNPIDQATKNFFTTAQGTKLKIGLVIDKGAIGTVTPTQDFINQVTYALSNYGSNLNFFSDFIGEFDCITKRSVDFTLVQKAFPTVTFLHNISGHGPYFTWAPDKPASDTTSHYSDANCIMGSIHRGFFDGYVGPTANAPQFNTSVWGGTVRHHNRVGVSDDWFKLYAAIPPTMKYVQLITGQDYEEGTALEGELSRATGIPLGL